MKFFQKTGVAVAITVLAIAAALFIGLSPVLKSGAETAPVQTVSSQDTSAADLLRQPPGFGVDRLRHSRRRDDLQQIHPRRGRALHPQRREHHQGLQR